MRGLSIDRWRDLRISELRTISCCVLIGTVLASRWHSRVLLLVCCQGLKSLGGQAASSVYVKRLHLLDGAILTLRGNIARKEGRPKAHAGHIILSQTTLPHLLSIVLFVARHHFLIYLDIECLS